MTAIRELALRHAPVPVLFAALAACGPAGPADVTVPPETPTAAETVADAPLVPIRNARTPLPGVLTGGQPTEEQLRAAAEAGYTAVIDLRMAGEHDFDERGIVERLGMTYHAVPVDGSSGLTRERAEALDAALLEAGAGPVMVHCGSGNRVGALIALHEHWIRGREAEASLETGLAAGLTSLEPDVRAAIGLPVPTAP